MRQARRVALAVLVLSAGGCMDGGVADRPAAAPAARVIGAAQSCIPLNAIRETRIRDDATIDFIGPGRQAWRNTLPASCPTLRSENRFTYETSLSSLCNTDIIYVLQYLGSSYQRGPSCGLGQFVPVEIGRR